VKPVRIVGSKFDVERSTFDVRACPMLKLLFIGDIVGRPGRDIVVDRVPRLRKELSSTS